MHSYKTQQCNCELIAIQVHLEVNLFAQCITVEESFTFHFVFILRGNSSCSATVVSRLLNKLYIDEIKSRKLSLPLFRLFLQTTTQIHLQ